MLKRGLCLVAAAVGLLAVDAGRAEAVDGVVLIAQNTALAGNVTPGDTAGFPVTISRAGSYRLSSNLTVPDAFTTGIMVTADNVTLDLNGFGIFGPGTAGSGDGVFANQSNVTVMNGSTRGMGANGVRLSGNSHRVEKVYSMLNDVGILVEAGSTVIGSTASFNRTHGIVSIGASTVLGNTMNSNTRFGMLLVDGQFFPYPGSGYAHNVLSNNNAARPSDGQMLGGTQMGGNVCGNAACP